MNLLVCFILTVLLAISSEGKPAQFNGYPEENRNVNGPFSGDLFEGDMLVGSQVKKIALTGGDVSMATGRKRGATKFLIWPNGVIPYVILPPFSDAQKAKIENAMREWENGTCLSFVPYNKVGNVYLKISGFVGFGCVSFVGYKDVSKYPSPFLPIGLPLNLDHTSCLERPTILHELGHAIGFWHEQSRPDRDNFVRILSKNIIRGRYNDFSKYDKTWIDSLGFPYDLKSMMHYGPKTFSKNGKNTIEPVDSSKILEKNENISDIDKQQVNKLYNCV